MPSKKYLHDIDLVQNQLLNAVLDSRSSAPASGVDGQIYYNNASKQFFYYNGTTTLWQAIAGAGLTNPMTALGDIIYGGASGAVTRLAGNITTTKQFLSQTGTGSASAAPTWATLAGSDITGAALTSSNDTNVTITLGGTPATSLLRAASLTLGWTGTLAVARGGTGLGTLGTANQLIRVNAGGTALEYFTSTFLTANQTITLTGVVTGSGTTSITTAIANGAITNAMLANGAVANLSGTNSGDNAVNSLYSGLVSNATHTGDATGATTLTVVALRGVALPALGASAGFLRYTGTGTNTWVFDTSVYITANQTITLTGNVTGSGTTAITTTIGTNVVTNAMLAQIATARIRGRVTAGTGNVEDLTGTQATTLLDSFAGSVKGLVPVSVGGTTNFLRADGVWAAPAGGGGGGSPAGSNTQIQYNNSGAFGASASLTWDGTAITAPLYKRVAAIPVNTVSDAILLENTTAATGVFPNVGFSPAIHFKGTGWPNPGSSSVPIDMRMYLTSESFGQASGRFVLDYSSNGSAYKEALVVDASTSFNTTLLRLIAPGAGAVLETQGASVLFTKLGGQHDIVFGDGTVAYFSFRTDASTTKMSIRNYSGSADLLTVFRTSGNVVIANTSDNGVDKLQVNGSAIATSLKITGGTAAQILAADGSVITAGTGITISGGTISSTGGGGGGTTTFAVTFNNSGTGAASSTTFDGSAARTISYNTIGANKVITSGASAPTGGVDGDIYLQTDISFLTGSGAANQIAYFSSATAVVGSNDYQWDNTNKILTVNGLFRGTVTANRQTASYTLVLGDNGKLIEMNVGSANNLTVPLNSSVAFPIGTQIDVIQYGAGQTTIVATSGVTINSQSGYLKIGVRYSAVTLIKIGTNEWYCIGNLVA
jgi:hypothetical protein